MVNFIFIGGHVHNEQVITNILNVHSGSLCAMYLNIVIVINVPVMLVERVISGTIISFSGFLTKKSGYNSVE